MEEFTADFLAILIDYEISGPSAAGYGLLHDLLFRKLKCLVFLIYRNRRIDGACLLRSHADLLTVFYDLHSIDGNGQLLIDEVGLNRHRIIGIINKFEVRSAEAHGRVFTRCYIGRLVAVRMALRTLKSCKNNGII